MYNYFNKSYKNNEVNYLLLLLKYTLLPYRSFEQNFQGGLRYRPVKILCYITVRMCEVFKIPNISSKETKVNKSLE